MNLYRNEITTVGRIISERRLNDKDVVVTLITKSPHDVYPQFICKKSLLPLYKEHSYVEVTGYADSHYGTEASGKPLIQKMYATSVRMAETVLCKEFGVKGRFWEQKPCMLYVSGIIKEIMEDDNYIRYILMTENPVTTEMVPIKIDWKKIDRHPEYGVGDKICAICKITTPKKRIGTEDRVFLNFNVFDMDYV